MSAIEHELVWHASRNPDNISGRKFLTGATLNGAVALLMKDAPSSARTRCNAERF